MTAFSIVIPLYNREREIVRALGSCLAQEFADFEVVVVDDGSTDSSVAVVEALSDPRIKLLRHEVNRGHCAARNTGVRNASGDWIVFLDSDDELLPGALESIRRRVEDSGEQAEQLAFNYRYDDGRSSPFPALQDRLVDYRSWLGWRDSVSRHDYLFCTKRLTFNEVALPEDLSQNLFHYQFDFSKRYTVFFCRETVASIHTDAGNRITASFRVPENWLHWAAVFGEDLDRLLSRHGEAMREFAPLTSQRLLLERAVCYYLAGDRVKGTRQALLCVRARPLLPGPWSTLILGIIHPRSLAKVIARKFKG